MSDGRNTRSGAPGGARLQDVAREVLGPGEVAETLVDEGGIVYHLPSGEWRRADDMDVNYMMAAEKRLVLA